MPCGADESHQKPSWAPLESSERDEGRKTLSTSNPSPAPPQTLLESTQGPTTEPLVSKASSTPISPSGDFWTQCGHNAGSDAVGHKGKPRQAIGLAGCF